MFDPSSGHLDPRATSTELRTGMSSLMADGELDHTFTHILYDKTSMSVSLLKNVFNEYMLSSINLMSLIWISGEFYVN